MAAVLVIEMCKERSFSEFCNFVDWSLGALWNADGGIEQFKTRMCGRRRGEWSGWPE